MIAYLPHLPALSLNDLIDVSAASPSDGQALVYSASAEAWQASSVGSSPTTLVDLTDTTISSETTGEYLRYSGSAWVNSALLWDDLTGVPSTFAPSAHTTVSDITDFPSLATVATTGDYDDLSNTPTIPDALSIGSSGQVPFVNGTNDDLSYSSALTFASGTLAATTVQGNLKLGATGSGVAAYFGVFGSLTTPAGVPVFVWGTSGGNSQVSFLADFSQCQSDFDLVNGQALRFQQGTSTGTVNRISLQPPNPISADTTYTLPVDGSSGQVLQTNGSGVLSWATPATKTVAIPVTIESPSNQTYPLIQYLPEGLTLTAVYYKLVSGTCSLDIRIDGASVTPWSALSATSTEANSTASGSNTAAAGTTIDLVVSSVSSAQMLSITIVGEEA